MPLELRDFNDPDYDIRDGYESDDDTNEDNEGEGDDEGYEGDLDYDSADGYESEEETVKGDESGQGEDGASDDLASESDGSGSYYSMDEDEISVHSQDEHDTRKYDDDLNVDDRSQGDVYPRKDHFKDPALDEDMEKTASQHGDCSDKEDTVVRDVMSDQNWSVSERYDENPINDPAQASLDFEKKLRIWQKLAIDLFGACRNAEDVDKLRQTSHAVVNDALAHLSSNQLDDIWSSGIGMMSLLNS